MTKLGLGVVPTGPTTWEAMRIMTDESVDDQMVVLGTGLPATYYALRFADTSPRKPITEMLQMVTKYAPQLTLHDPSTAHCTMYFRGTQGPDLRYESRFKLNTPTTATALWFYYTDDLAVVSLQLSATDDGGYRNLTPPHISLGKLPSKLWRDAGVVIHFANGAYDWEPTSASPIARYSPKYKITAIPLHWSLHGTRVRLIGEANLDTPK